MFGTSAAGCKCISVNDNEIMWSNRVKHLGNVIDCDLSDVADSNIVSGPTPNKALFKELVAPPWGL